MSEGRVLVAEDDPKIQRLLQTQLTTRGYDVSVVDNGLDALTAVEDRNAEVVLLDIAMPGLDGISVCRRLREWSDVPVILVTASDSPQTKVEALEMGADDYLTKPFHVGELVARIRAVRRRTRGTAPRSAAVIEARDLRIDLNRRQAWLCGRELRLTKIEFDLLRELASNADRVLSYTYLLAAVWGAGYDDVRPLHVHICNLRRKLEPDPTGPRYIISMPGVGYRFRMNELDGGGPRTS